MQAGIHRQSKADVESHGRHLDTDVQTKASRTPTAEGRHRQAETESEAEAEADSATDMCPHIQSCMRTYPPSIVDLIVQLPLS